MSKHEPQPKSMQDPEAIQKFALAGHAILTLRSAASGNRFTYRVRTTPEQWHRKGHIVELLTGRENTGDYSYVGMLREDKLALTKGSKMTEGAPAVKAFQYFASHVIGAKRLPPQLEVWHEGRCGKCSRLLTVPESIARGIGPECAGKMGIK